jgi:hypothetical protein
MTRTVFMGEHNIGRIRVRYCHELSSWVCESTANGNETNGVRHDEIVFPRGDNAASREQCIRAAVREIRRHKDSGATIRRLALAE